jgi:uncharacterized protein involved in exopolysaccharide biosynthesis
VSELKQRNTRGAALADITLRDLVAPLFRRKRLVGACFVGLALLAILATISLSSTYKCRMEILVNQERLDPSVSSEATSQTPVAPPPLTEEDVNSEVELLLSPDLLEQVVLANRLQEPEKNTLSASLLPRQDDNWYVSKAVDHLAKKLTIEVVKKTNMIEVSYKSKDPKLAFGVMDKLAGLYMEKHLTVHRPTGSYEFFAKETEKYQLALAESEKRLGSFGQAEGVVAPDIQRTDLAQEAMNSVASYHRAQQSIAADEQRIKTDEAQMNATPSRSSTQQVSNTAALLLQQLETNLLAARIKRTQLALKYDPSYPLVQEADQEIAQTETAIAAANKTNYVNETTDRDPTYELLREDIAKTQSDLSAEKATAAALQHSVRSMQEEMVSLDQKAVKQADLIREVKADEANYLLYLSKREQERTSDALDQKRIGNVAIAVPPILPRLPAYSPLVVMVVGFFVALFLSAVAAFAMEYLDASFRTPTEVNEILGIPVLAFMPKQTV